MKKPFTPPYSLNYKKSPSFVLGRVQYHFLLSLFFCNHYSSFHSFPKLIITLLLVIWVLFCTECAQCCSNAFGKRAPMVLVVGIMRINGKNDHIARFTYPFNHFCLFICLVCLLTRLLLLSLRNFLWFNFWYNVLYYYFCCCCYCCLCLSL